MISTIVNKETTKMKDNEWDINKNVHCLPIPAPKQNRDDANDESDDDHDEDDDREVVRVEVEAVAAAEQEEFREHERRVEGQLRDIREEVNNARLNNIINKLTRDHVNLAEVE